MLGLGIDLLEAARHESRAVAGFSTYTLESTRALCAAAEASGRPVILQLSEGALVAGSFAAVTGAVIAAARACTVPVGVHLDHARDLELVHACLAVGFTSVMIDGSALELDENIALTKAAAAAAHRAGAWIEAELGPIAGDEHASSAASSGELTDPTVAGDFAKETDIDLIAAAVGTVHGRSTVAMALDVERIDAIVEQTGLPFCLHGASGLAPAALRSAIAVGTAKVNFNAELRRAYLEAIERTMPGAGDDVTAVMVASSAAVEYRGLELLGALEPGAAAANETNDDNEGARR